MTYEGFRLKVLEMYRKLPAKRRRHTLKHTDFTIISNNCWGGMVYECYGIPKQTPTVGLYFMAADYIKFISNLRYYINQELVFISSEESQYYDQFKNNQDWVKYVKGRLDDVEIVFMHYHSKEEAYEKWRRRCKRINWDKIIIKFNDQNGCTREDVEAFFKLPLKNKLFFTVKHWGKLDGNPGMFILPQHVNCDFITASHEPYVKNRIFNVTQYINDLS